jgi:serine O-acetyltransferase
MKFSDIDRQGLVRYVCRQVGHFFPDDDPDLEAVVAASIETALARTRHCINAVKPWPQDALDVLHTSQYTTFLYFLGNQCWLQSGSRSVCNKLFGLNKALNGIDLFYETKMPEIFFIGHSVGIVIANVQLSDYLVLFQNCTIGRVGEKRPEIGRGVVLFPSAAIVGACRVGDNTVVSQGCALSNIDIPGNTLVFRGDRYPIFKPMSQRYVEEFFRLN